MSWLNFFRSLHINYYLGTSIDQVGSSSSSSSIFNTKILWNFNTQQHASHSIQNNPIKSLCQTIILRHPYSCLVSYYVILYIEVVEHFWTNFKTIISLEPIHHLTDLVLNQMLPTFKILKGPVLGHSRIDL